MHSFDSVVLDFTAIAQLCRSHFSEVNGSFVYENKIHLHTSLTLWKQFTKTFFTRIVSHLEASSSPLNVKLY